MGNLTVNVMITFNGCRSNALFVVSFLRKLFLVGLLSTSLLLKMTSLVYKLILQMAIYFNYYQSPIWLISHFLAYYYKVSVNIADEFINVFFSFKYDRLSVTGRFCSLTIFIVLSLLEPARLYLGNFEISSSISN